MPTPSTIKVLSRLKRGRVSIRGFSPGFRLAARIYDLRVLGHNIRTEIINGIAYYRLIR